MSDLVKVIWSAAKRVDGRLLPGDAELLADHVVRSGWFAQARVEARREALLEAANELGGHETRWGGLDVDPVKFIYELAEENEL